MRIEEEKGKAGKLTYCFGSRLKHLNERLWSDCTSVDWQVNKILIGMILYLLNICIICFQSTFFNEWNRCGNIFLGGASFGFVGFVLSLSLKIRKNVLSLILQNLHYLSFCFHDQMIITIRNKNRSDPHIFYICCSNTKYMFALFSILDLSHSKYLEKPSKQKILELQW